MSNKKASVFILPTTLAEFALLASSRIGREKTQAAIQYLTKTGTGYLSIAITDILTEQAVWLYQKQTSKEESLFDCFVMVVAKKIAADAIFSFDKGYQKNKFILVSSLLSSD